MRIIKWLHLWLGLFSGVIVFIVSLTGGIWVLRDEVTYFTEPFHRLGKTDISYQSPSVLHTVATSYFHRIDSTNNYRLNSITYRTVGKSCYIDYTDTVSDTYMGYLHLNPHNGAIIHNYIFTESATHRFLEFVRKGHRFLWLPRPIGSPLVGTGCLMFMVVLFTGIFWWYPKKWTKSTRKKSFRILWSAKWKRLNIDLHNVLGFYVFLVALLLTYTGIYYSFQWYRDMHHSLVGEASTPIWNELSPKVIQHGNTPVANPIDRLWETVCRDAKAGKSEISLGYTYGKADAIQVTINPYPGTYYGIYNRYFDPVTLAEFTSTGFSVRNGTLPYEQLSTGQKIIRLNSDLHVGSIGGLTTKIMACIACMVCASLPITGTIIWYNKRFRRKKK